VLPNTQGSLLPNYVLQTIEYAGGVTLREFEEYFTPPNLPLKEVERVIDNLIAEGKVERVKRTAPLQDIIFLVGKGKH
jgi:hypothetical protein